MDRFMFKISIGYPDYDHELDMLSIMADGNKADTLSYVATTDEVIAVQNDVRNIFVSDAVRRYVLDIITATRSSEYVLMGCSPRAGLQLLRAAQATAFYEDRDYVIPDDVRKMTPYVLPHRIMLGTDAKVKGVTKYGIIDSAVRSAVVTVE